MHTTRARDGVGQARRRLWTVTVTATVTATAVMVFAAAGAVAGTLARLVVGRMPRGVLVPRPWCEGIVAVTWAILGWAWMFDAVPTGWLPTLLGLAWLGAAAGAVDLLRRRLPNALTLPAIPAALVLLAPLGPAVVVRGLVGAVIATAAHAAVHVAAPRALGAGDVKLAASVGAVLGAASWSGLAVGMGLAALLTGLVAAVGLACRALRPGESLPHGPSLLLAAWFITVLAVASSGGAAVGDLAG